MRSFVVTQTIAHVLFLVTASPALARDTGTPPTKQSQAPAAKKPASQVIDGFIIDSGPPGPADPKGRYYVEFRARPLNIYGHTYIVYGRLDDSGMPAEKRFVGLHPENGQAGLAAGSTPILVPATTLPVSGDSDLPVLAGYRRSITPEQYRTVQAFVYEMRSRPLSWNLYTQNCNFFAGELAKRIGLKIPLQNFQFTPLYVRELEALNRTERG